MATLGGMVGDPAPANDLPGAELVREGLRDLEGGLATPAAALLQMARTRLGAVGVEIPAATDGSAAGHRLYDLLSDEDRGTARSRCNALVGRIVGFMRAAERARAG